MMVSVNKKMLVTLDEMERNDLKQFIGNEVAYRDLMYRHLADLHTAIMVSFYLGVKPEVFIKNPLKYECKRFRLKEKKEKL